MNVEIFKNIPFAINEQELKEALQLRDRHMINDLLSELVESAQKIAIPKAIYTKSRCDVDRTKSQIVVDGKTFNSKVLAENMEGKDSVFPYVITCGMEIEEWSENIDDIMEKYIVDGIKAQILFISTEYVSRIIKEIHKLNEIAYHIPGYLDDWPIQEQRELFSIFGDEIKHIGVYLTDSSLMRPVKSVSGIYY